MKRAILVIIAMLLLSCSSKLSPFDESKAKDTVVRFQKEHWESLSDMCTPENRFTVVRITISSFGPFNNNRASFSGSVVSRLIMRPVWKSQNVPGLPAFGEGPIYVPYPPPEGPEYEIPLKGVAVFEPSQDGKKWYLTNVGEIKISPPIEVK